MRLNKKPNPRIGDVPYVIIKQVRGGGLPPYWKARNEGYCRDINDAHRYRRDRAETILNSLSDGERATITLIPV